MTTLETLLEAFKTHDIKVLSIDGDLIKLERNYEIEVEANGMYKLIDEGYIVAPFSDINKLCQFILT